MTHSFGDYRLDVDIWRTCVAIYYKECLVIQKGFSTLDPENAFNLYSAFLSEIDLIPFSEIPLHLNDKDWQKTLLLKKKLELS